MTTRMSSYLPRTASLTSTLHRALRQTRIRTRQWSIFASGDKDIRIDALRTTFPYVWLRDSCQGPECVYSTTTQKLYQTSDISPDVRPVVVKMEKEDGKERMFVHWEDGHRSFFDREFLERHSSKKALNNFHGYVSQELWDNDVISRSEDLFIQYDRLKLCSGLVKGIEQLWRYGLLFVRGVPNEVTDHKHCELRRLVSLFSHLRPSFYGELWDIQNKVNSDNIAYTDLNLGFHMDLLYFSNPPRYQALHCIRNKVEGGESLFVDAFKVAYQLKDTDPLSFKTLSKTPVSFQYVLGDRHYHQLHPTIQLSPTDDTIKYVNYSPPFQAPLLLSTPPEFYHAIRKYCQGLQEAQNVYRYTLREGDVVLFDNRRVLHARTAFKDFVGQEGTINRWLIGCYFEGDDMWDLLRSLKRQGWGTMDFSQS